MKKALDRVQPPLLHMARLSEPLGVGPSRRAVFAVEAYGSKGAMAKRWKPIRPSTKRDWPVTLLVGGAVIWLALLVGLLLSSYIAPH